VESRVVDRESSRRVSGESVVRLLCRDDVKPLSNPGVESRVVDRESSRRVSGESVVHLLCRDDVKPEDG
jgi:hypothetical protein